MELHLREIIRTSVTCYAQATHRPIYSYFPAFRAPSFLTIIPIYTHIIPTAPSGLDNFRAHEDNNITSANDKSPGFEEHKNIAPARNNEVDDDELERKVAKARALEEEIEMEERLAKLKRERRALQDQIEDAKRKKQKHGEE
jgi:hypothetical protein